MTTIVITIILTVNYFMTANSNWDVVPELSSLYNHSCCQEDYAYEPENGTTISLSVDIFTRLFRNFPDLFHQNRVLVVYTTRYLHAGRIGGDFYPNPISMGNIDENSTYIPGYFVHHCTTNGSGRFFGAAFAVDGGDPESTSGEMFFACGQDVKMFKPTNMKELASIRRELPKCDNISHPVFCNDDLMEAVAVPTSLGDKDPFVIGYYGQKFPTDRAGLRRPYTVRVWKYSDRHPTRPLARLEVNGWLSAVDIYRTTTAGVYGFYFTTDGNVCPFYRSYTRLTASEFNRFAFEDTSMPRLPCQSIQVFIGCPMNWCFDQRFDASFTVEENQTQVAYFLKGIYAWKVRLTPLPLRMPRVKEAYALFGNLTVYDHPCSTYNYTDNVACIPPLTNAAAVVTSNSSTLVYFNTRTSNRFFVVAQGNRRGTDDTFLERDPFYNRTSFEVDAMWFNKEQQRMYVFYGGTYNIFSYTVQPGHDPTESLQWKAVSQANIIQDFNLGVQSLDAIVAIGDKAYFFKDSFYFTIEERSLFQIEPRSSVLSFDNFFAVKTVCFDGKEQAYSSIIDRYNRLRKGETTHIITKVGTTMTGARSALSIIALVLAAAMAALAFGAAAWATVHFIRMPSFRSQAKSKLGARHADHNVHHHHRRLHHDHHKHDKHYKHHKHHKHHKHSK